MPCDGSSAAAGQHDTSNRGASYESYIHKITTASLVRTHRTEEMRLMTGQPVSFQLVRGCQTPPDGLGSLMPTAQQVSSHSTPCHAKLAWSAQWQQRFRQEWSRSHPLMILPMPGETLERRWWPESYRLPLCQSSLPSCEIRGRSNITSSDSVTQQRHGTYITGIWRRQFCNHDRTLTEVQSSLL